MFWKSISPTANEFYNWHDLKVAAFREFSRVINYILQDHPEWFRRFNQLSWELHELIIHEHLLLEREAGRLSRNQHYAEFKNPCCKWEYPDPLIACDGQDTTVLPKPETGRYPRG